MPIPGGNNELYFATGIDNTGLMRGRQQAVGIIGGMASQISKTDVFAGLAIAATVAFGKVSKEMKAFSQEFEHSMKEVQTISQAVQGDFDGFSQSIIDMTTGVPQSANELSKAYYQIVSAGYDGAAGLALLQTSAEAAVGGVSDVTTAADGMTTVMNAWKIEASQATDVSDIFFNTVKKGKTTFGELASNIAQVAPLAAAYKVGVKDIFSATATLTKQGTTTSMAMTQLRQALIAVNEELGQGWSETYTLQEAFQELADRAVSSGKDIKEFTGRVEGAMAIMSTTGENAKMAAEDLASYGDAVGSSNEAFKTMVADSINQSKLLKNNLKAALKPLGDFWSGKSTEFARSMNEAFKSGQIEKFGKFVATTTAALVAYKLTANGAALTTNLFAKATVVSTTAMKGLNAAFKSNPFGMIAAGITIAVSAFKAFKSAQDNASTVSAKLNEEISADIFSLNSLFDALKNAEKGSADWNTARETINSRYGDYLGNLLDEKTALDDIEAAQKRVTEAMIAQAAVKVYQEELDEQMRDYQGKFDKTMGDFTEAFATFKGADRLPEFIIAINKGIDQAIKEGGGQIERGMLEYSQIATDIYNKYINDLSQQTGYIKWDPESFTEGFLDIAQFKAKESDFTEYLQAMIASYKKMIGDGFGTTDGEDPKSTDPGIKILDLEGLDKEIEKAEKAFQEIDKLRKAGLYDESKDLYSYYTKYGNNFDAWLSTMKGKYQEFSEQLKSINLALTDSIIEDIALAESSRIRIAEAAKTEWEKTLSDLGKEIDAFNKELEKQLDIDLQGESFDPVDKVFLFLGKIFSETELQDLEYNINQFGNSLSNLGSMVSRFDQQAGESVQLLGQMVSNAGAIVNFADNDDIFALMNGIIGIADGIVGFLNAVSGKEAKEALKAEEIERQAYKISIAVESINRALAEQYNILAKLEGAAWITGAKRTIDEINKAFSALESQMQNIRIELDLPGYTGPTVTLDTEGWGAEDFEKALRQHGDRISEESRAEVQSFLDQLSDLQQEAEDLRIEIKLETVGFSMDSLVDDVMSMFDQMKDGAVDFGDTFEEIMQKALLNSFQQTQVTRIMQDFYDELYTAMESPVARADRRDSYGGISPDEFAELEESWNAKNDSLQSQYEFMLSFMEKMGMDIGTGPEEPGDDPNSLSGSIRRSLTEETGSILAGRMTNMMLTMNEMAGYQADMVDHLAGIENNTSYNQHLAAIDSNIREIRTQLTP